MDFAIPVLKRSLHPTLHAFSDLSPNQGKKLQQWFHFYFTLIFRNLILLSRAIYTILFIFSPKLSIYTA